MLLFCHFVILLIFSSTELSTFRSFTSDVLKQNNSSIAERMFPKIISMILFGGPNIFKIRNIW